MNGALAITFSEIKAYLEVYPWFDIALFIRHVIALDITYKNHYINLQKQKAKSNG